MQTIESIIDIFEFRLGNCNFIKPLTSKSFIFDALYDAGHLVTCIHVP